MSTVILGFAAANGLSSVADERLDTELCSPRLDAALTQALRELSPAVLSEAMRASAAEMIPKKLQSGLDAANRKSTNQWRKIRSRGDWERFREEKLRLLREAIGPFPESPARHHLRVTAAVEGDGYRVKNLVFQSRPGLWVTANLYVPANPGNSMPGILICHSHHTPKQHGELQDMGMTWARQGCLVLVPDLLGHGERRQHPFVTEGDYHKPYRAGRQDYYFRFDMGMQLHIVGETLMGWFVWDLWRCVDVLLDQKGVDPNRIILLGAVAGGGDPAAVAAALDQRIKGTVAFNFGGPQPETAYPLPEDAELTFNYAGSGSFESTRNLRRSASDGFVHWTITGAIAPRRLVYAHEFAWDRARDPVWKRFQQIWGEFYDAEDHLAAIHGRGSVKGQRPESTHCTHIGSIHRGSIHPVFRRWFGISTTEKDEYSARLEPAKLHCMPPELARDLKARRLCDLLSDIGARRVAAARQRRTGLSTSERCEQLRRDWSAVLGPVKPPYRPKVQAVARGDGQIEGVRVERVLLGVEPEIVVPLVLLLPASQAGRRVPVVCAMAHAGKGEFLQKRAAPIAELLNGSVAVCLPDLRGLGETRPAGSRERWAAITNQSSTKLMLGGTTVGARLRDLRSVLMYLRGRSDVDPKCIALWGDSFAEVNAPDRNFQVPRHVDDRPRWSEPLGGLLVLLGALYEDDVCAVYVRRGLSDFQSVLAHQFVYIPHDVVIPGVLTTGDLPDLAAGLAPRPLRMDNLVDGYNRLCSSVAVRNIYRPTFLRYEEADAREVLVIQGAATPASQWLLKQLADDERPAVLPKLNPELVNLKPNE